MSLRNWKSLGDVSMTSRQQKPKSVALIGTCPRCGESVELIVTKKQVKALMKGFKTGSPSEAERMAETILRRDRKGNLK